MAAKDERLKQWWAALSEQERADVLESQAAGQLSDQAGESLRGAGLAPRAKGKPAAVASDVAEFLKMRH